MHSRKLLVLLLSSAIVFALLACSPFGLFGSKAKPTDTPTTVPATATNTPVPATNTPAATAPSATPTTAAQAEATAVTEATATATTEAEPTATTASEETEKEVVLPQLESSLQNVQSYSAVMEVTMRKQDQTEDQAQHFNIVEEADRASNSQRLVMEGVDENGEPFKMEIITIGQDSWIFFGEGWMHTKSNESDTFASIVTEFLSQGDSILSQVRDPQLVEKGVEVNGIKTNHYHFEESNFEGFDGEGTVTGDVWIAQEDNYIVKMVIHSEGEVTGTEGEQGVVDMTWELLSINQPVEIKPPEGMSAEDMLPAMPGAEESETYFASPDMAMYEIEATIEDVIAFYDAALAERGFTKGEENIMEGLATVSYTKEAETINLMLTTSEDKEGIVNVIVSKEQQ